MSDLKIVSVEEEVQMAAQTENTVGIAELCDSDLEGILGGAQSVCGSARSICNSRMCCRRPAKIGDIVSINME